MTSPTPPPPPPPGARSDSCTAFVCMTLLHIFWSHPCKKLKSTNDSLAVMSSSSSERGEWKRRTSKPTPSIPDCFRGDEGNASDLHGKQRIHCEWSKSASNQPDPIFLCVYYEVWRFVVTKVQKKNSYLLPWLKKIVTAEKFMRLIDGPIMWYRAISSFGSTATRLAVAARRELALQIEVNVARYHMITLRINLMNISAVTIFLARVVPGDWPNSGAVTMILGEVKPKEKWIVFVSLLSRNL